MIKRFFLAATMFVLSFSIVPIFAREANGVVELRAAPTVLNPAKAYLLFRSSHIKLGLFSINNTFMRIPTQPEIEAWLVARKAAYAAALPELQNQAKGGAVPSIDEFTFEYRGPDNTFSAHGDQFFLDGADLRTYLLEVPAGEYVVYGVSASRDHLITCNCLGTVAFEARAGMITNVGSLYADNVYKQSSLSKLESNVGPSIGRYGWLMGQALVPPTATEAVPEVLRGLPVEPAQFRAVGPFHDRLAVNINRLAPIPGILAYDHGKVIDVKTGALAR